MKWTSLERIPKIPWRLALRNPRLVIRKAKPILGKLEIRMYDVLIYVSRKIAGME